jgi:hypothetical protein
LENIQIQDLYELYPDFDINVQKEQELLFEAEVVIFQLHFLFVLFYGRNYRTIDNSGNLIPWAI